MKEKRLKILVVSQYFYPENVRITDYCLSLKNRGHEVYVLTGKPNYPKGKYYPGYGWFKKKKEYSETTLLVKWVVQEMFGVRCKESIIN